LSRRLMDYSPADPLPSRRTGAAMKMPIYLDYNATTPVDPRVVEAMMPCMETHFGNPSSATHAYGWAAARLVDRGREQVAAALGVSPDEVVFTSGATEADNLAIKGVAACHRERGGHIVTSVAEHKAVLNPCRRLGREGFTVTEIPTDGSGRVDPAAVAAALRADTILVSIMLANNEIGTIQPIAEIAALCRARGVLAHHAIERRGVSQGGARQRARHASLASPLGVDQVKHTVDLGRVGQVRVDDQHPCAGSEAGPQAGRIFELGGDVLGRGRLVGLEQTFVPERHRVGDLVVPEDVATRRRRLGA